MLEGIAHLLELQRLDSEISRREAILNGFPDKREQHAAALAEADSRLETVRADLTAAELGQRAVEATLQDRETLLRKLEQQQFQVKNNTAYTALLSEMERAQQAISECETRILEEMEKIELSRDALASAEADAADTRARVEAARKEIDAREQQLTEELSGLASERALIGPKLDAKIFATYERVAKARHPALALVSNEMCEGCRVGIPAQNYIDILKGEQLIVCGNCRRILLHRDMVSSVGG